MPQKHRVNLTPGKREIIGRLMEEYDIASLADIENALKDLLGGTIKGMLEAELDEELGYEKHEVTEAPKTNYRNGYKPKTLQSTMGEIEIDVPQDRNAAFTPKVVPKHKTNISEIEQKIIRSSRSLRERRPSGVRPSCR